MRIRVGQLGARMYYGIPRALSSIGYLESLYTDFSSNKGVVKKLNQHFAQNKYLKTLTNRYIPEIETDKIHHLSDYGLIKQLQIKLARNQSAIDSLYHALGIQLEKKMMHDGLKNVDAITMIGSSSSTIFKTAKEKGISTITEQIIAPSGAYKKIIETELDKYKNWQKINFSNQSIDFWQEVNERDWEYADHIICGSNFVKECISNMGGPIEKVTVIPYGVPTVNQNNPIKTWDGKRKLRVLFVGAVGLRKGAQYLIEAAQKLHKECEFRFCGNVEFEMDAINEFFPFIELKGHVNRNEIGNDYAWADIFVLPSLFEGSATVGYEAIQYNLPIITTKNSGQFIQNEKHGFIINIKSSEAIIHAINHYLVNPDLVNSQSNQVNSLSAYSNIESYKDRIITFYKNLQ